MSFVHSDGSFSAFGTSDESGSTWLTALVVKSFAEAAQFTFIDRQVISGSMKWLLRQQTRRGDFSEPGIIHHKTMQGRTPSTKRTLTAFVLIALYEARTTDQVEASIRLNVEIAITKATSYITKDIPVSITDLYELAVVTYALTLINHPSKDQLLSVLEKYAKTKDGEKHWSLPSMTQPWREWSPPSKEFNAIDVELTSYALLIYNEKDDITNSLKILKWLTKQRQSGGGFISAMDTILAVQAMAGLGEKLSAPNLNADVAFKGRKWSGKTFKIDQSNALVLNIVDAPKQLRSVSVEARGTGVLLVEAVITFNILEELREPAFNLSYTLLEDSIYGFKLRPCFSWIKKQWSTMALLEISIPTGMEADLDSLNTFHMGCYVEEGFDVVDFVDTTPSGCLFKKAEKAFRQINLYFDAITTKEMCIDIKIERVSLVARHKAVPVTLTEISEPSNQATVFYESKALASATIIQVCGAEQCTEVKKK